MSEKMTGLHYETVKPWVCEKCGAVTSSVKDTIAHCMLGIQPACFEHVKRELADARAEIAASKKNTDALGVLVNQFQFCINRAAETLGGVCCGGVDSSPEDQIADPNSTTRVLCDAITKEHERAEKFKWQVRDTCKRAEKAESERDAYAKDAERYRWLREHNDSMSINPPLTVARVCGYGLEAWSGDDLDAAMKDAK